MMEATSPEPPPDHDRRPVRIVVLDDHQAAAHRYLPVAELRRWCEPDLTVHTDVAGTEDELVTRLRDAEIVVAMRERSPLPARVLERLDTTRLIVTSGARNAAIDHHAAAARGIVVCGTRGKDAAPAELTWALLLALVRRLPAEDAGIRAGRWGVHVGHVLEGRRLGVLGYGDIGSRVARYGLAFGMEVLAHSRSLTREAALAGGASAVDAETLLRESDVVSLHLKLTKDTAGTIGRRELGLMQRSAVLINTGRGGLVDEPALVDALRDGTIAGAGLDVFAEEPLPAASPLRELDNVVMTPHIGYVTDDRYRSYFGQAVENIVAYLRGAPIRELV
jgi:phosphoglycerate dehydrogenase-like enzyme